MTHKRRTTRTLTLLFMALATLATAWGLVGCGAAAPAVQQEGMPSSVPPALDDFAVEGAAKIDPLITRIQSLRAKLGAPQGVPGETPLAGGGAAPDPAEDEETLGCSQVCEISDGICDSSAKICAIASQSLGDMELGERCSWATEQCKFAQGQCSGCQ